MFLLLDGSGLVLSTIPFPLLKNPIAPPRALARTTPRLCSDAGAHGRYSNLPQGVAFLGAGRLFLWVETCGNMNHTSTVTGRRHLGGSPHMHYIVDIHEPHPFEGPSILI